MRIADKGSSKRSILQVAFGWMFVAVAVGVVVGCTVEDEPELVEKPLSKVERASCLAIGGIPYVYGLTLVEGCVMPPADFGKQCSKSSECKVACNAETRTCQAQVSGEVILDDGTIGTMFVE